ncbi:MAG TPA: dihydrodipicolinate synthase family protein [Pseudonocardiaceae bacterium]|nr:dihydrodipicolinate synthase family protein [Pseudonocardiaceae bacterium]
MTVPITGTWFVSPTPFTPDGAVDVASIHTLVDAAVDWGVDGVTGLGVMGEATALTDDERSVVQEAFVAASAGRIPVAVGCSAASAAVTASRVAAAVASGAAAVMVSAPTLARDTDLIGRFYATATKGAGVPVIVQDEPAATGVRLPVSALVAALDATGSTIVKLEDPPTPPKISRLLAVRPGLTVFGGLGGVNALWELRNGGAGTMTGFAFPEILRALRVRHEAGDRAGAAAVFDRYLPYIAYEGQTVVGLPIRKEVLRLRGAIACARTRDGAPLDDDTIAELHDVLARVGLSATREPVTA